MSLHLRSLYMKKKNQNSSLKPKRKSVFGMQNLPLFSALLILGAVAIGLSGLISTNLFRASAQSKRTVQIQDAQSEISESARQQIAALVQEKMTRSAARKKMDSQLIYGIKMARGEQLAPGLDALEINLPRSEEGQPVIDITARVTKRLIARLEAEGAKILVSLPRYNTLRVEISLDALDTIADLPEVIHLQPKQEAMTSQEATQTETFDTENLRTTRPGFEQRKDVVGNELLKALTGGGDSNDLYTVNVTGVRKSEADTTQRVAFTRNNYGFDGTGIKIGVLSDGVRNLAAAQASGDIGPVTVLPGQSGTSAGQCSATGSCDEGTAMLELVHDLAPGAQLYFATAFGTSANFAQNIRNLRAAGCDIIIDDVFYFSESPFQDGQSPAVISPTNGGIVAQAVNDVTAGGALYFSSAGNSGNKNDNTSGVWEGDFVDGGDAPAPIGAANGRIHQFPLDGATPAQTFNVVVTPGSSQYNLNWSDPLGGSANDYDLYALNAAGTALVTSSTNTQSGTQDPFEAIGVTAAGTRLVIVKFSGAARFLRLTTNRGRLTVNTPGQTSGHSTAANAFGVAATPALPANGGPFPGPHVATNVVETFSSDGPRKLFYQPDGTAFTPGNVSSTGGIVRQKPDITATDGTSVTGAGGFGITFFGTSAAAPHAGAIAAIIKQANPSLTPAQIRTTLTSTSIDIEGAGVDRDSGSGIVMADSALASLGLLVPPAYLSLGAPTVDNFGGNLNEYLEPGEGAEINIPLINTGIATATTVSATISSTTPGVTLSSPTRTYPDIAANGGTANPVTPFFVLLQPTFVYAADIDFVLTVTYNGGSTLQLPFKIPTGQLANISTTLDTTAPVSGTNYAAATGTQTGRMNFTFPLSACGANKTNPATTSALARRYDSFTFANTSASSICVTALLTHSSNVLLHLNAYLTSFTPATPGVNWRADGGGSTTNGAGTTQRFSFDVPANTSFVLVVSESNQNGGLNTPYNLRVTGLPGAAVAPTAASANVSGRVSNAAGQGLANARVTVTNETGERLTATTNAFGYYSFENLVVGQTYVFNVASKRYTFSNSTQVIFLGDDLSDLNFISDN